MDDVLRKYWEIENHNVKQPALSIDECTVVDHKVKQPALSINERTVVDHFSNSPSNSSKTHHGDEWQNLIVKSLIQ